MKKHAIRLSTAILTFCLGTAIAYLPAWPTEVRPASNLPYSVLEGSTVRIHPYKASFEIPDRWATPRCELEEMNLHLSRRELKI